MKRKLICRALTVLLPFLLKLSAAPPQVKRGGFFNPKSTPDLRRH